MFGDGEAKINLLGADGAPALIWAEGISRGKVRRAMRVAIEQQLFLMARWEDIHGGAD